MKKTIVWMILVSLLLLLCGCQPEPETVETTTVPTETEETVPVTVPADGSPDDVTCKGTYTAQLDADAVVAAVAGAELTNEQLQAVYWAEVAAWREAGHETAPDFSIPLDTQVCSLDDTVGSWQQYFLKRALNTWHSAQALVIQSQEVGIPTEEAYQPNLNNYEIYLKDIPATKYLYGYDAYEPNTMHQEFLDNIPAMLEELSGEAGYAGGEAMAEAAFGTTEKALAAWTQTYNQGYIYLTNLSYALEAGAEDVGRYFSENEKAYSEEGISRDSGVYVDFRHVLLIPEGTETETVTVAEDGTVTCSEAAWEACLAEAESLVKAWQKEKKTGEGSFADMANKNSADTASAVNGGGYCRIREGQLIPVLNDWCFDEARQPGDTEILRSEYGYHIVYFSESKEIWYAEAEQDLLSQMQAELIAEAREAYPMNVDYGAITLAQAEGTVSSDALLYPDIAHQRFPEIPLYLQQDYPKTMYGGFKITTNGCGITSFAMLASYMADDELTPPEMCERYGGYSHANGTDGMIFNYESPVLGFYLKEKTYDPRVAKAALQEGHIVISIQHKGYWTRGGHYIVLENIDENDMVQVRDSNIFNYGKLAAHKEDRHNWKSITGAGSGYWIFEYKITNIPACSRCGAPEEHNAPLTGSYICEKCTPALLRRNTYLAACGE